MQNVFIKLWKLLIKIEYRGSLECGIATFPLEIGLYGQSLPIFIKALGPMYDTDQYVARFPEYADSVIFFDRFCYDMVSLLGKNVFILQHNEIEFIFRKAYKALSHNFSPGKVEMLQLECVRQTPFQENQRYSSRLLSPEEKSMNLVLSN